MKKALILLFCILQILIGCSKTSSNEDKENNKNFPGESKESIEKKSTWDFLLLIYDDTFKGMTSEVSDFTKGYFQPLYQYGKSVDLIDYIEANKTFKKAVEVEETHMEWLQMDLDLSEYENKNEVSNVLKLQIDLINSAKDYAIAMENWITAESEESKKYLDEGYKALTEYGNLSEEYSSIIDKNNNAEVLTEKELEVNMKKDSEDIRITNEEKGGTYYWKGNNELVSGKDWMSLTEKEKKKLILLNKEHLDSEINITLEKSSEEYVELMNNYFSDESKLDETIKDVLVNFTIEDITNKNK